MYFEILVYSNEQKIEPKDVTSMGECTFCILRTLNRTTRSVFLFDKTSTLHFALLDILFPSFSFIDCLSKSPHSKEECSAIKVFLDVLSSHSSANGRTDERRKK